MGLLKSDRMKRQKRIFARLVAVEDEMLRRRRWHTSCAQAVLAARTRVADEFRVSLWTLKYIANLGYEEEWAPLGLTPEQLVADVLRD